MKQIAVEQFALLSEEIPQDKSKITLNSSINFKVSKQDKSIASVVKFKFEYENKPFIILEVFCAFQIKEEDWNGFIENEKIKIPKDFLKHITLHTVGTARGILHCKTEGTPFNIFILPPINVEEAINEDFIIE